MQARGLCFYDTLRCTPGSRQPPAGALPPRLSVGCGYFNVSSTGVELHSVLGTGKAEESYEDAPRLMVGGLDCFRRCMCMIDGFVIEEGRDEVESSWVWDLKHVKRWQIRGRDDGGKEVDDEVRRGKGLCDGSLVGSRLAHAHGVDGL